MRRYLDKNYHLSSSNPNKDDDNDGLTYAQEQALGTSDNNPDSDGDGFPTCMSTITALILWTPIQ